MKIRNIEVTIHEVPARDEKGKFCKTKLKKFRFKKLATTWEGAQILQFLTSSR